MELQIKNIRILSLVVFILLASQLFVKAQELRIVHLDVRQGSSVYIDFKQPNSPYSEQRSRVLIDAGNRNSWLVPDFIDQIKRYSLSGVSGSEIEYIISTHYDIDHIGGLTRNTNNQVALGLFARLDDPAEKISARFLLDLGDSNRARPLNSNGNGVSQSYTDYVNRVPSSVIRKRPSHTDIIELAYYEDNNGNDVYVEMKTPVWLGASKNGNYFDDDFIKKNPNFASIVTLIRMRCVDQQGTEKIVFAYANFGDFESYAAKSILETAIGGPRKRQKTDHSRQVLIAQTGLGIELLQEMRDFFGNRKTLDLMSAGHHGSEATFIPYAHVQVDYINGQWEALDDKPSDDLNFKLNHVIIQAGETTFNHPRPSSVLTLAGGTNAQQMIVQSRDYQTRRLQQIYDDCVDDNNRDIHFIPPGSRQLKEDNKQDYRNKYIPIETSVKYDGNCDYTDASTRYINPNNGWNSILNIALNFFL